MVAREEIVLITKRRPKGAALLLSKQKISNQTNYRNNTKEYFQYQVRPVFVSKDTQPQKDRRDKVRKTIDRSC